MIDPILPGPDPLERARRQRIAHELAVARGGAILARFREGERAVLDRVPDAERTLILNDWPIARRVVALALPEVIEGFLDVLADGFSPWLLEQVRDRCLPKPDASPSSAGP